MSGELDFIQLLWRQIKLFQAAPEVIEGLINRVGHQKQAQVFGADHSPFDQRVKIDNFNALVKWGMIGAEDLRLFLMTDSVDEAFNYLRGRLEELYLSP